MAIQSVLFPRPPRASRGVRLAQLAARTVHVVGMGLVLGGVACRVPGPSLAAPIALTVASGVALLALDLWKSCDVLHQGNGLALLLKLALLGLGLLLPAHRLAWYVAATAVASVGSHMPRTWRHWSLLERRVMETG
jgi:hypothetical protein